jgi:hypothetical protein
MEDRQFFDLNRLVPTCFRMALPVVFGMLITPITHPADTYA